MTQPLRVGLMVDGDALPFWAVVLLDQIAAAPDAQIVLIVVNTIASRRDVRELGDWFGDARGVTYRAWLGLEYLLHRKAAKSFAPTPLPKRFVHVPRLPVMPSTDERESLVREDLERLAIWNLDVLLQFGFGALRGGVLGIARYGVWRLRLGSAEHFSAGPPAFWEVVRGAGEIGAVLEIVAPGDCGIVLAQGAFTSNDHSVLKNREGAYWPASRWVLRELAAARRIGEAGYQQRLALRQHAPFPGDAGAGREPSLPTAAWQFLRAALWRPIKRKVLERTTLDQWALMFAFSAIDKPEMSLQEFRMLRPPIDRFWADPCVIAHEGRWWVFFEEFIFAAKKGVLAVLEIFEDGTWSTPQRILELPCHLSYPFVFEHDGEFYMVPETSGQRSIDLYRATEFPYQWQKQRTLIDDIEAVDATLIEHAGRWWLFANVVADPHLTTQDELWLFSTDDPIEGTWLPHADNPVVSDAMSARPAGRLWRERSSAGDRLLRPSQNSAGHYGHALQIQEVLQLDDADFREVCVTQIKPGWQPDIVGVHTLSFAGGLTVIDALVHHSKFSIPKIPMPKFSLPKSH